MQNEFDTGTYSRVYGDVLVKHKLPIEVSFTMTMSTTYTQDQVLDYINKYVDENNDSNFNIQDLIKQMYKDGVSNNIIEPVVVNYSRSLTKYGDVSGSTTGVIRARNIEYFKVTNTIVEVI
jgi:hypothetical protein